MEQAKKKKIVMTVAIVSCVIVVFFMGLGVEKIHTKSEQQKRDASRWVIFIDTATGKRYMGRSGETSVKIPYDGKEHVIAYEVYREPGVLIEKGDRTPGHTNKPFVEPGQYMAQFISAYKGRTANFCLNLTIVKEEEPKLQPEMKFEPNGAIEWTDGEYYKYKYTGEYCYPIAYAEYNGVQLKADRAPLYLIISCYDASGKSVATPKEIGVYEVEFAISHYEDDPNGDIYGRVVKTVTVEIVA